MTTASPATLIAAVRTAYLANASLTGALGSFGIRAGWLPDNVQHSELPGITLHAVGFTEDTVDRGPLGAMRARIQSDIWVDRTTTGAELTAYQMHGYCRAALQTALSATGWRQVKARITGADPVPDPDPNLFRLTADVFLVATPS